jgi:uncharacterized protein
MSSLKYRVEKMFANMAYGICNHPIKTLLLMAVIIGSLISQMPRLTIDTSFEGMLHADNPLRIQYNKFRDQFGQDRVIICAVQTPEIFDVEHLTKLRNFHHDLERELPHLDEVKSLINARRTRGEGDTLIVEDFLEDWPEKPVDLAALKIVALHNPVYRNDYISEDGTIAALIIKPIAGVEEVDVTDLMADFEEINLVSEMESEPEPAERQYLSKVENKEVVDAVYRVMERYQSPDFRIAVTGGPVLEEVYDSHTKQNMRVFTLVMMVVIFLSLGLFFRRLSGAFYPLIIVYLALLSTLGVMAVCKVSISVFSVVMPSLLMAVGIADAVHILAIFYRRYQQGDTKIDSIAYALGHSGLAVMMTSLTTIAGLLSFSMSELSSIGHLGIFASVGVALAFIYTVIMLPALLAITPIKMKKPDVDTAKNKARVFDAILIAIGNFASGHPKKIVVISMIVMAMSTAFMLDLKFSHHHKNIYPPEMKVRQDQEFIDGNLKGAASVEVVLDTGKENGLYQPELLHRLDRLTEELLAIRDGEIYIGKVRSINDILKETNQALHANDPSFYTIPDEQALIAQELLLFENSGSDDLEKIADGTFRKTRISIKVPYLEVLLTEKMSDDIYNRFRQYFDGLASVTITGMSPMMGKTVAAAIRSMSKSYVVAFFVITLMMVILVGDVKLGLLSMIPNLFPIFLVMGIMGAFGVLVDLNALMIGSIAIGMVVDDTMHFMYNFRRYYELSGDAREAVRNTLLSAGRALMITSIVLASSFFTLLFATFTSTHKFGFFTGLVILVALLADFILAPALVVLAIPYLKIKQLMSPQPASPGFPQHAHEHVRMIEG